MSIEKSDKCRLCQSDPETFMHLFVPCSRIMERFGILDLFQLGEIDIFFTPGYNPRILTQG